MCVNVRQYVLLTHMRFRQVTDRISGILPRSLLACLQRGGFFDGENSTRGADSAAWAFFSMKLYSPPYIHVVSSAMHEWLVAPECKIHAHCALHSCTKRTRTWISLRLNRTIQHSECSAIAQMLL